MSAPTAAQTELISSLSGDEIPIKLRCAICSRLAVNAFRLPCCEQAICETCQSTLSTSCPVCEHSPIAAEDCKPNKTLRTTIKVFLRTEEKKREALRVKEAKETPPPATPQESVLIHTEESTNLPTSIAPEGEEAPTTDVKDETPAIAVALEDVLVSNADQPPLEEQKDIPQPSIEEIAPGQEPSDDAKPADDPVGGEEDKQNSEDKGQPATQSFGDGFGFNPATPGAFPMGFGGDFNQMQMMMMQNGMGPNNFGTFPMMGMPGMGMDPISMQNMFVNGGFGAAGLGMNGGMGMGIGMGMGGFDGGVSTGFNNGWNPQQSWNIGPDNFNHPNASGMGLGDYGSNNSGFAPQSAGYNQGNYGRPNQYNDYQNNYGGYQGRGRGRGRGGFNQNRGGYGYGSTEPPSQQFPQQFGGQQSSNPEAGTTPIGLKAEPEAEPIGNVDEFGREIRQPSPEEEVAPAKAKDEDKIAIQEDKPPTTADFIGIDVNSNALPQDTVSGEVDENAPRPIQSLDTEESSHNDAFVGQNAYGQNAMSPIDPNSRTYNPSRGGYSGHSRGGRGGSFGVMQPPVVKTIDIPINAPTGPKAMREGLPNTGLSSLRTRNFSISGRANTNGSARNSVSVAPDSAKKEVRSESPSQERDRERSRSRSRSRERKRERSRERRHRRHRHRSTSRSKSEDDEETEKRRERRRERRRREEEGDNEVTDDGVERKDVDDRRKKNDEDRSASPTDSKRDSHRSRRDRDKYRDRDDVRDSKPHHKHRSSHRSRRDDRSRSRDRDREREHRHRSSRHTSHEPAEKDKTHLQTPVEVTDTSHKPSLITNGFKGIEIKGASSRKQNSASMKDDTDVPISIPTGPKSSGRERERPSREARVARDEEPTSSHRSSHRRDSERSTRDREKEKEQRAKTTPSTTVEDPYKEREQRNRERLLKEAQRIAGLTAGLAGGRKHGRDEDDAGVRKGRKKGRRDTGESEEARIARLEAERESARWDY